MGLRGVIPDEGVSPPLTAVSGEQRHKERLLKKRRTRGYSFIQSLTPPFSLSHTLSPGCTPVQTVLKLCFLSFKCLVLKMNSGASRWA